MLGAVPALSERVARARRALNAWARGPSTPHHDTRDFDYFLTYIERRAVLIALAAYALVVAVAALISDLIWGEPQTIAVGFCGIAFWPLIWFGYLRNHYKPEFKGGDNPQGKDLPGDPAPSGGFPRRSQPD
jgi:hypothetical protein